MNFYVPYDDIRNWDLNAARSRKSWWLGELERATTLKRICQAEKGLDDAKRDIERLMSEREKHPEWHLHKRGQGKERWYWKAENSCPIRIG